MQLKFAKYLRKRFASRKSTITHTALCNKELTSSQIEQHSNHEYNPTTSNQIEQDAPQTFTEIATMCIKYQRIN